MARLSIFVLAMGLALCVCASTTGAVPTPAAHTGIFVLDNCDPLVNGKDKYDDNLSFVDGSNRLVFRQGGLNMCETFSSAHLMEYDSARNALWILENGGQSLRKYDRTGRELLTIRNVMANAVAVDLENGNVWVLGWNYRGGGITVYDAYGQVLGKHSRYGADIVYDRKRKAFWLVYQNLEMIPATKTDGAVEADFVIEKTISTWFCHNVEVDPKTGRVWTASRKHPQIGGSVNEILGFDFDPESKTIKKQVTLNLGDKEIYRLSVDPNEGSLWVTLYQKGVNRYDSRGKLEKEFEYDALACQADWLTGGAWVVTSTDTMHITRDGKVSKQISHKAHTSQAWITGI